MAHTPSLSNFVSKFKIEHQRDEQILDLMDDGLAFMIKAIDLNIEIQELIIEIKRKKIKSEMDALMYIHIMRDKHHELIQKYQERIALMQNRDDTAKNQSDQELYNRFYGRISEKVFCKFIYYSLNHKNLQFTTGNLLSLYQLMEEAKLQPKESFYNMYYFHRLIAFILDENTMLHALLLDLIVSQNYVSSCDQFLYLKAEKQRQYFKTITETIEEEEENDEGPRPATGKMHFQRAMQHKVQVLQGTYKREIEALATKFHDKAQRDSFLTSLSNTIKKEISAIQQNPEQEKMFKKLQRRESTNQVGQKIISPSLFASTMLSKRGSSSKAKRIHIQDPETERLKDRKASFRESDESSLGSRMNPRLSRSDLGDFFVGTYAANLLSKNAIKQPQFPRQNNAKPKVYMHLNVSKSENNESDLINSLKTIPLVTRTESKTFTFNNPPVKKDSKENGLKPKIRFISAAESFAKSITPIINQLDKMDLISSPKNMELSKSPLSVYSRGLEACMDEFVSTINGAARRLIHTKKNQGTKVSIVKTLLQETANLVGERQKQKSAAMDRVCKTSHSATRPVLNHSHQPKGLQKDTNKRIRGYQKTSAHQNSQKVYGFCEEAKENLRPSRSMNNFSAVIKEKALRPKRELYHIHLRKVVGSYE